MHEEGCPLTTITLLAVLVALSAGFSAGFWLGGQDSGNEAPSLVVAAAPREAPVVEPGPERGPAPVVAERRVVPEAAATTEEAAPEERTEEADPFGDVEIFGDMWGGAYELHGGMGFRGPGNDEPLDPALAHEFVSAAGAGLFTERYQNEPGTLAWMLMDAYQSVKDPSSALQLLQRYPQFFSYEQALALANQFAELEQPGPRADALAWGLENAPWDGTLSSQLVELDPARAISILEAKASEAEEEGAGPVKAQLAAALAAGGEPAKALAVLDGLLREGKVQSVDLELLLELDPDRAERALDAVRAAIARGEDSNTLRRMLTRLDPEAGLQHLRTLADQQTGDPSALVQLGRLHLERGDAVASSDAFARAVQQNPGDTPWSRMLEKNDRERLISEFESALTGRPQDDELWGDLGDVYARGGRLAEALQCYQQANQIDPGDGEWTGKIEDPAQAQAQDH